MSNDVWRLAVSSSFPVSVWVLTVVGLVAVVVFDVAFVARSRREVSNASALRWLAFYVGLAIAFGVALLVAGRTQAATEFFSGYVTEYSLSVDNLFVFIVIMSRMAVPTSSQDKVLMIGIVVSMLLRAVFIVAGAAAIAAASWTFYVLGAFLLYTALSLALETDSDETPEEGLVVRQIRRVVPISDDYADDRFVTRVAGARVLTPLVLAIAAIGIANVVFALDSIPAIFGLTTNSYVVLTANAFALLGLRQLFFLVERLLARLVYLKAGLVVILGFIGVKLILEALEGSPLGDRVPQVGTSASLLVILGTLLVVSVASLARGVPQT
jgi:TerC family integral membrane protein